LIPTTDTVAAQNARLSARFDRPRLAFRVRERR
jgi:hypothetical protein